MLEIALEKVCYIIAKSREFDVKVDPVETVPGAEPSDDEDGVIQKDFTDDPTLQELRGAIESLNEEESVNLVALMWLGRGDFGAEEWEDCLVQARTDRSAPTVDYLVGTPLLSDYLEDGLNQLGLSCEGVD